MPFCFWSYWRSRFCIFGTPAWSGLGTRFFRRFRGATSNVKRGRLIPNILAIAKQFMSHEAEVLQLVTRLRSQMSDSYDST